ncbi:MAG: GerW family sporulation protein [Oscillospiraceae bacterium]|nr:GerW family sporulation protein [Oscillospiraceae bacterium]
MADNLKGLLSSSMEKIRDLVDVNAIIGDPITSPDGTLIIPISKVTFGFVSGGSDIPAKATSDVFAGGAGAGVTIKPQAFIVIKTDGDVKLLEVGAENGFIDGLITGVPDLINKVRDIFAKPKEEE